MRPENIRKLTPVEQMAGEDAAETRLLQRMLREAESYLSSFKWCPPIVERYLGFGVGGVLTLFLFKLEEAIDEADQWLWVINGDLPSAYFVLDDAPDPRSALEVYCTMMEEWVEAVECESKMENVFPVNAPASKEFATMLRSRISFVRDRIMPNCE